MEICYGLLDRIYIHWQAFSFVSIRIEKHFLENSKTIEFNISFYWISLFSFLFFTFIWMYLEKQSRTITLAINNQNTHSIFIIA